MTAQPRKMSEIMKEMSEILLRHPSEVPSRKQQTSHFSSPTQHGTRVSELPIPETATASSGNRSKQGIQNSGMSSSRTTSTP